MRVNVEVSVEVSVSECKQVCVSAHGGESVVGASVCVHGKRMHTYITVVEV